MSLNVKNERVHDLAREASRLSGASQTSAVETALENYIALLKDERDVHDRTRDRDARLTWRLEAFRAALAETDGHLETDALYDDAGLPT